MGYLLVFSEVKMASCILLDDPNTKWMIQKKARFSSLSSLWKRWAFLFLREDHRISYVL